MRGVKAKPRRVGAGILPVSNRRRVAIPRKVGVDVPPCREFRHFEPPGETKPERSPARLHPRFPPAVCTNHLSFHQHRGIETISCLFSWTSWPDRKRQFFHLLVSITSWDIPSFFISPFFRVPSRRNAISGLNSMKCIFTGILRISPKSSCFHTHRGIRGHLPWPYLAVNARQRR